MNQSKRLAPNQIAKLLDAVSTLYGGKIQAQAKSGGAIVIMEVVVFHEIVKHDNDATQHSAALHGPMSGTTRQRHWTVLSESLCGRRGL